MLQKLSCAFRGLAKIPVGPAWRHGTRSFTASRIYLNTTGPSSSHSKTVHPSSGPTEPQTASTESRNPLAEPPSVSVKPPSASAESPTRSAQAGVEEFQEIITEAEDPIAQIDINRLTDGEFMQLMQLLDAKINQSKEGRSPKGNQSLDQKAEQINHSKHPDQRGQVQRNLSDSTTFSHSNTSSPKPFSPFGNSSQVATQPLRPQVRSGLILASSSSIEAYSSASSSHEVQPSLDIPPESDPLLAYLTSRLMRDGKRHAAARRTSRILLHIFAMTRSPPLPILRYAVELAAPSIRIVSHKRGGKMLHKPIPLSEKRRTFFAITWMLKSVETSQGKKTIEERFARQVLDIIRQQNPAQNEVLKKKLDVHTMGMVNRANVRTRPAS